MASTWIVVKIIDISKDVERGIRLVNFSVAGLPTDTAQVIDIDPFEDFVVAARQIIDPKALAVDPESTRIIYDGFGFENPDAMARVASRLPSGR